VAHGAGVAQDRPGVQDRVSGPESSESLVARADAALYEAEDAAAAVPFQ
jgi:hypothetical protein